MNLKITSNNNQNYKNTVLSFKAKGSKTVDTTAHDTGLKNSAALGVAAAAVSAAVIGGIAFAAGKNKVPQEVSNTIKAADDLLNTANGKAKQVIDLAISLQKKVDEACALFKNGGKDSGGNIIGKIIPNTDDKIYAENFLEEYSQSGTLLRKSSFIDDFLVEIEEFTDNGKSKNILKHNWFEGGIESYTEGYGKLADGSEQFTRKIEFSGETGGRLDSPYDINCLYKEMHSTSGAKNTELEIIGGDIRHYFEDYNTNTASNRLEIGRGLWLKYGEPDMYVENNTISKKGLENIAKELNFRNGTPVKCTLDSKEIEDGIVNAAKSWEYKDGSWSEITA